MFGDKIILRTKKKLFIVNLFHKLEVSTNNSPGDIFITRADTMDVITFEPKHLDWMINALHNVKKHLNGEHIDASEHKTITSLEYIHKEALEDYEIGHRVLKIKIHKGEDQINKKEYENTILLAEVKFLKDRIQDLLAAK